VNPLAQRIQRVPVPVDDLYAAFVRQMHADRVLGSLLREGCPHGPDGDCWWCGAIPAQEPHRDDCPWRDLQAYAHMFYPRTH